jgi:membrane-associated PAP2 superfamily phosphatase
MRVPVAPKSPALMAFLALAMSAATILWLGACTDIDLRLADAAFDKASLSFPMQHAWIAEQFNHVILKSLLSAAGAAIVMLALWDSWRPIPELAAGTPSRHARNGHVRSARAVGDQPSEAQ